MGFLFALAPPKAAEHLKHNMLEELGIEEESGVSHPSLLRALATQAGLGARLPELGFLRVFVGTRRGEQHQAAGVIPAVHMRRLVELYWRPIYSVIRHAYSKSHDDAKDLTQEFFATVMLDRELVKRYAPERGSFRALLRTALTYFMRDVARGLARQPGQRKFKRALRLRQGEWASGVRRLSEGFPSRFPDAPRRTRRAPFDTHRALHRC